jgi:hypothetical protein
MQATQYEGQRQGFSRCPKTITILWLLTLIPLTGYTWELGTEEEIRTILDQAMENFTLGNIELALKIIEPYTLIDKKEFKALSLTIREQRSYVEESYGAGRDWELATVTTFGDCLVEYMYFSKHDRYPLHWFFTLYDNGEGWLIINFSYDDKTMNLFPR